MKLAIIKSSPRENGNTNTLLSYFLDELNTIEDVTYTVTDLTKLDISPCIACRECQKDWSRFSCQFHDGMYEVSDRIMEADLILLATPIYSWYCTPPMKAMLDRLVYGMNKYYGDEKGPSIWKGKKVSLFLTCGYPIENGTGLFEEGIRRFCRHSGLTYTGKFAERHMGYSTVFLDDDKIRHAREFAHILTEK